MIKYTTYIFFFVFLLSFFQNSHASILDQIKNKGAKNIEIEIRIEDENRNELLLPIKVLWKNYQRTKTYQSVNFLEDSLVSLKERLGKKENYGYLFFTNTNKDKKVFKKMFGYKISYNFKGNETTKKELFFLQLKQVGKEYIVQKFYTKEDLIKEQKKQAKITNVIIKGSVPSILGRGIQIAIYNKKGERIYSGYVNDNGKFSLNLSNYKEKISLNKDYFLIWGKTGDVVENIAGFLYKSKKYNFSSYLDLIKTFNQEINLPLQINNKDKPVTENFPYIYTFFLFVIYLIFIYLLQKKLISKIIMNPLKRKNEILYEKRKNFILKIKKNNLGLKR